MIRSEQELRRKIDAARVSAATLKAAGHHFDAEQVLVLCRAASSLLTIARQQYADLQELRRLSTAD